MFTAFLLDEGKYQYGLRRVREYIIFNRLQRAPAGDVRSSVDATASQRHGGTHKEVGGDGGN